MSRLEAGGRRKRAGRQERGEGAAMLGLYSSRQQLKGRPGLSPSAPARGCIACRMCAYADSNNDPPGAGPAKHVAQVAPKSDQTTRRSAKDEEEGTPDGSRWTPRHSQDIRVQVCQPWAEQDKSARPAWQVQTGQTPTHRPPSLPMPAIHAHPSRAREIRMGQARRPEPRLDEPETRPRSISVFSACTSDVEVLVVRLIRSFLSPSSPLVPTSRDAQRGA